MSISRAEFLRVTAVAAAFAAYFIASSLLIHRSYHSNGWDLGIFDQVIWNTAHGRPFEYSFRDISYVGDHWQPILIVLAPVKWLAHGPEPLLVIQGISLAGASLPLFLSARRFVGGRASWAVTLAYLLGLGVHRTVSFDFHPESFAPLLAFTAFWSLVGHHKLGFLASATAILLLKEDAALLVLALAWIAACHFQQARQAIVVGLIAIAYGALTTLVIMPHFRGGDLNPLRERYGYLGDSVPQIAWSASTRPWVVLERLADVHKLSAAVLVLLAAGLLPLTVPRLLPPLLLISVLPMLSQDPGQSTLQLHYLLIPSVVSLILGCVALRERNWSRLAEHVVASPKLLSLWAATPPVLLVALPLALFAIRSPLPPSLAADYNRFRVGEHARLADRFVAGIPSDAIVSAQSPFVPHLAERTHIYQFPRVLDAEFVLLDEHGPIPAEDLAAGYRACQSALPLLGFDRIREDSGITLWQKVRPAASVPDVPLHCSGQRP